MKDKPQPKPETMSKDTAEKLIKMDFADFNKHEDKLRCLAGKKANAVAEEYTKDSIGFRHLVEKYKNEILELIAPDGEIFYLNLSDIYSYNNNPVFANKKKMVRYLEFTKKNIYSANDFRNFVDGKAERYKNMTLLALQRNCLLSTLETRKSEYEKFHKAVQDFINDTDFVNKCWNEYYNSIGTVQNNNC